MPQTPIDYATPNVPQRWPILAIVFLSAGFYVLACIPLVFLFEAMRWPEYFIHTTQMAAAVTCFAAATIHLARPGQSRRFSFLGAPTWVWAAVAVTLTGTYLLLLAVVVATLDFSSIG